MAGARASRLKRSPSGHMVSARSKTGDPACSQAMSMWQRARHSGAAVAAGVFHILAQCRAKARAMGMSQAFHAQGNALQGQVYAKRAERGLSGAARSRMAQQLRAERAAKRSPAASTEIPFSLARQSAYGRKSSGGFVSSGGRTGTMFDVGRRGEARGQTSLLERVGHVETTADRRGFREQVLDAARQVHESKRFGGNKVFLHHVHAEHQRDIRNPRMELEEFKRRIAENEDDIRNHLSRADMVQGHSPADLKAAEAELRPGQHGSPSWHFVRVEGSPRSPGRERLERLGARTPELQQMLAKARAARAAEFRAGRSASAATPKAPRVGTGGHDIEDDAHAIHTQFFGQKGAKDNFVLLHNLRNATGLPRERFDAAINHLRRKGVMSLDSHEGLANQLPAEVKASGIREAGSHYQYASFRDEATLRAGPPKGAASRQVAHQLPAPMHKAERVKTLTERRREERAIFPVQHGKAIVRGPAAAISAARSHQERNLGASLFGGKRIAPDTGPVKPIARTMGGPATPGGISLKPTDILARMQADRGKNLSGVKGGNKEEREHAQLEREAARHAALKARAAKLAKSRRDLDRMIGQSAEAKAGIAARAPRMAENRSRTAERLKSARARRLEHESPETHGKADKPYIVKTSKIEFDPERFQYKLAAQGSHGVTDALSDVKSWNPKLAGIISVWKDPANGKTYVVNGHHRLDLAKRLGVSHVKAQYLDAKDATEARGFGAMVNIAEGRGTGLDAGKFFRDTGVTPEKARAEGVSLKEHVAKQGLALSNLHPRLFKKVVNGDMSAERGAIIGGSGLSHAHQESLGKMLEKPKFRNATNGAVKNLIDIHKASESKTVKARDLFGESEEEQSLALHRATLEGKIKRRLASDSRLFGLVSKSKAAESLKERGNSAIDLEATGRESEEARGVLHLFEHHKHLAGPLNRSLNEGAERLHGGENAKKVESEHYKKAVHHLKRILENPGEAFAS